MMNRLRSALDTLDVENVFIYVGDAVRWDHRPAAATEKGITAQTIAASIHSPPSFASLVTGRYPPAHGVFSFKTAISSERETLFDLDGVATRFQNSVHEAHNDVDPIYDILRMTPQGISSPFEDLSEPFVVMERGPGGHAPYDRSFSTAGEYFRQNTDTGQIREDYREAVREDGTEFQRRLTELEESDLLEETLVIYTSDHGELLGEGGAVGHNAPMRPELVRVPTIFIHPTFDSEELGAGIVRQIDLVPTVLDLLDIQFKNHSYDGVALGRTTPPSVGLSFYQSQVLPTGFPVLSGRVTYEGMWDASGGFTFADTGTTDRLAVLAGKVAKSPKRQYLLQNLGRSLRSYLEDEVQYGNPTFTRTEAKDAITTAKDGSLSGDVLDVGEEAEQHLRDLGYL